jgi:hypothetical protein
MSDEDAKTKLLPPGLERQINTGSEGLPEQRLSSGDSTGPRAVVWRALRFYETYFQELWQYSL